MKILRLKNGIEKKIPYHFNIKGLGVMYNSTTYKGKSGLTAGDACDLKLGDGNYLITQTPLTMIDRIGINGNGPLGFKYAYPIIIQKGEKLTFSCKNASIAEDDINLLLYGLPIGDDKSLKNKIQKKPNRLIKLHTFLFGGTESGLSVSPTGQEMGFDQTIHVLSLGFAYAEKLPALVTKRFMDMPDAIKGYVEIVGHLYYIFEDKSWPLNLLSDMYKGYRSETKWYNAKQITVPENDLIAMRLNTALTYTSPEADGDQHLWTMIEYYE